MGKQGHNEAFGQLASMRNLIHVALGDHFQEFVFVTSFLHRGDAPGTWLLAPRQVHREPGSGRGPTRHEIWSKTATHSFQLYVDGVVIAHQPFRDYGSQGSLPYYSGLVRAPYLACYCAHELWFLSRDKYGVPSTREAETSKTRQGHLLVVGLLPLSCNPFIVSLTLASSYSVATGLILPYT